MTEKMAEMAKRKREMIATAVETAGVHFSVFSDPVWLFSLMPTPFSVIIALFPVIPTEAEGSRAARRDCLPSSL
jgi:hypothetical protein